VTFPAITNTAEKVITLAYRDAGLLEEGDVPDSDQIASGLVRVNDLINLWQTQGLKLFLLRDIPVVLVAGQATYTLMVGGDVPMCKPLRVLQGYYMDTNNIRRPLVVLSWEEYLRLSTPVQQGQINSYFVDKQYDRLNVSFWLVPDAVAALGEVHLLVEVQVLNVVEVNSLVVFPPEWFLALRWGLADDLATGQPPEIMQRCSQRAEAFRRALEDWDVEDASTYFSPDQRALPQGGPFKY
jgi:hypothetical protein